jgi:hypothetical protein
MDADLLIHVVDAAYKIMCLVIGFGFAGLGYRLFQSDIKGQTVDLEVGIEKWWFKMKRSTPGALFALSGVAIVALTIWKGLAYEYRERLPARSPEVESLPAKPPFSKPRPAADSK